MILAGSGLQDFLLQYNGFVGGMKEARYLVGMNKI